MRLQGEECPQCAARVVRSFNAYTHDTAAPTAITVMSCKACGLGWQWPVENSSNAGRDMFESKYARTLSSHNRYYDPEYKKQIAVLQKDFIQAHCVCPGRLLDIGCGAGIFVDEMAGSGWNATGVDPAAHASGSARLIRGTLNDLPSASEFDAITLWDVIEHVEDPAQLVRDCHARLAPGGYIFLETGNYQSSVRIASGADWWCYQKDHRWYFHPASIDRLLKEAGFSDLELCQRVLRPHWHGSPGYAGPSRAELVRQLARRPWSPFAPVSKFLELRKAARDWPQWSNLDIFSMAARKPC